MCTASYVQIYILIYPKVSEAATGGFLSEKVFLEIPQNSQENACARISFLLARSAALLKKRLWYRCFPVDFEKFLRTPFSQNFSGRLLLKCAYLDTVSICF